MLMMAKMIVMLRDRSTALSGISVPRRYTLRQTWAIGRPSSRAKAKVWREAVAKTEMQAAMSRTMGMQAIAVAPPLEPVAE